MVFEVSHNVEKGTRQLLSAPFDVAGSVQLQGKPRQLLDASRAHREIYQRYLVDFATAYAICDDWWDGCVTAFVNLGHSIEEASELAFEKRVAGPASAPEFVWFVRSYWREFDELNKSLPAGDRIPPATAMLGWLVEDNKSDYVRLITCMPYWPIGLDEHGNWC